MFVYIGTYNAVTGTFNCPINTDMFQCTGNLVASLDPRCDFTQLDGPIYGSCTLLDSPMYASLAVTRVSLIVDAGWAFPDNEQTILVSSVRINDDTFTIFGPPTNADQCRNDGWMQFNNPAFRNQGECVSYVATGR